jgi:predicted AlkP superfamily pyrophosphatase or phosphodiesterase
MWKRASRALVLLWLVSAAAWAERPFVVLVSIDAFRYDYAGRYHAANLLAIRDAGASATALIPSFPSITFPNHISIVTGLYPEHHGIVMNQFYDPARNASYDNKSTATDGSWYSGTPLWVLAEQQHVKAASMFWPASDSEIQGVRPTYWSLYDQNVSDEERVDRVIGWLKQPEAERPHFITLYFSDVDTAGHNFGPESPETERAVLKVDGLIGDLRKRIAGTGLPVNLVVVSDHGMQAVTGAIDLRQYTDLSKVRVVNEGPFALIYSTDREALKNFYRDVKAKKNPAFSIYWRKDSPARWHYRDNPRAGDIIVMVNQATTLITKTPPEKTDKGRHGYDPGKFKTMDGIFYAEGPNIRPHGPLKPFINVDIYPFLAEILGLTPPAGLDGSAAPLQVLYRK